MSDSIHEFIAAELSEFSGQNATAQFEGDEAAEEFPYQYWQKADGEIYVGAAWATELKNRMKIGHRPLTQFGEFLKINPNEPRGRWDSTREPWRRIFQHPDGAAQFTVQQIRDMGWHKAPPYRGISFPQLDGVKIAEFKCPTCGRGKLWSEHDLMAHETIAHKETSTNNSLARAIASAQKEGSNSDAMNQILGMLAQGQQQMAEAISALTSRLDSVAPQETPPAAKAGK